MLTQQSRTQNIKVSTVLGLIELNLQYVFGLGCHVLREMQRNWDGSRRSWSGRDICKICHREWLRIWERLDQSGEDLRELQKQFSRLSTWKDLRPGLDYPGMEFDIRQEVRGRQIWVSHKNLSSNLHSEVETGCLARQ